MKVGTKLGRIGVLAASAIAAMMAAGVVSEAAITITAPNTTVVNYTLAPGATSAAIEPPSTSAVLLGGISSTAGNFGVGTINLVHITSTVINWVGQESATGAITHGGTTTPGTHVVFLDASHKVDVEILSADELVVHNAAATTETGKIKLIW